MDKCACDVQVTDFCLCWLIVQLSYVEGGDLGRDFLACHSTKSGLERGLGR